MPEFHLEQTISTGGGGLSILLITDPNANLKLKIQSETFKVNGRFTLELPPTDKKIPIEVHGDGFPHEFVLELKILGVGGPVGLSRVSDAKLKVKVPKNSSDFFLNPAITGPSQPGLSGKLTVENGEKRVIQTLIPSKQVGTAGFLFDFAVLLQRSEHQYEYVFKSPEVILQSPNYTVVLVAESPFASSLILPQPKSFREVPKLF